MSPARLRSLLPWSVLGLAGVFALRRLDNTDTWWHLASGRWIAENGSVPDVDTLSYTATDRAWINLQWLWDLLIYQLFELGGADLLVIFSATVWVAATALMIRNVRLAAGPLSATVLAAWVVWIGQDRFAVRPEMFSFFLLQLVLWLLGDARRNEGRRLWMLVPIVLVWVNSHSLFVIGVFAVGCAAVLAVATEHLPLPAGWREATAFDARTRKRLLAVSGVCLAATLANPYLHRGVSFPFELLSRFGKSSAFQSIGEFRGSFDAFLPDPTTGAYQLLLIFGVTVAVGAGLLSARVRVRAAADADARAGGGFDLVELAIFAGLVYASLLAHRNMALFAAGGAPFIARSLRILRSRPPVVRGLAGETSRNAVAAGLLILVAAASWFVSTNRYYRWDDRTHEFGTGILDVSFPVRASKFMKEAGLPGRMYNDLTSGGYLSWSRPIEGGVFIDGRLEVYDELFSDYRLGFRDARHWMERADSLGINTAIFFHRWPSRWSIIGWLQQDPGWGLVYFDEVAIVFVRVRGHEEIIARARSDFEPLYEETWRRLSSPPGSRGYPVGRVLALRNYATLLGNLGNSDAAAAVHEKSLELDLLPIDERDASLWLAEYHRNSGEPALTRQYIERAARADPDDDRVRAALTWLADQ